MRKMVVTGVAAVCILLNCFPAASASGSMAKAEIVIGAAPGMVIYTDEPVLAAEEEESGFRESIFLTDLGLTVAQQKRFWEHATAHNLDSAQTMKIYVFYVATAWAESNFRNGVTHGNDNGTTDGGIMQVNSCNVPDLIKAGVITSAKDLHDPILGIDAGCWMADEAIRRFGVTEKAYFRYNCGFWTEGKSNKNSRRMWAEYQKFAKLLMGREL